MKMNIARSDDCVQLAKKLENFHSFISFIRDAQRQNILLIFFAAGKQLTKLQLEEVETLQKDFCYKEYINEVRNDLQSKKRISLDAYIAKSNSLIEHITPF